MGQCTFLHTLPSGDDDEEDGGGSDEEDDFDTEDEEIPEQVLAFATTPMSIDSATNVVEEVVTQVQQWTDESGYTWRKMSDESIQWWNGTDWQDHA